MLPFTNGGGTTDANKRYTPGVIDTTIKATRWYADVKVGARAVVRDNHGIDLIATIPLNINIKDGTRNLTIPTSTAYAKNSEASIASRVKYRFGISLAYNYTF